MARIAIKARELVSISVSSALDSAAEPDTMLARLEREIEEALAGLQSEIGKARRRQERRRSELDKVRWTEADWSDKAQLATDHGRKDLARQALMAREGCRASIERMKRDIDRLETDILTMKELRRELETRREDVQQCRTSGDPAKKAATKKGGKRNAVA